MLNIEQDVKKIEVIVLNIYEKNESDALIKVLSENQIFFFLAKGFFKLESKNRTNVMIGSISEFEFFNQYGKNNYYLLKKVSLTLFLDFQSQLSENILQNLLSLFSQIEKPNKLIFNTYKNYLSNNEIYNKFHLIVFLFNLVFETKGQKLSNLNCVICGTNQNLYAIDLLEGGIFCFKHKTQNCINDIKLVKSFYYLGTTLKEYIKNTDEYTNNRLLFLFNKFNLN